MRRLFTGMAVAWMTAASTFAEFSPLSFHSEGQGIPVAQMGARERGMGEAGMAALSTKGYFLPNISRAAYFDRTIFVASLETDMDWLHDNSSANHQMTTAMPTVATFIKTKNLGAFGAYYQQTFLRNFGVASPLSAGMRQDFTAEGGLFLLGAAWAWSPIPLFSLGFSQNVVLGHDRLISAASFSDTLINAENVQDTLQMDHWGTYPTFSGTLHTHRIDAALSFTPSVDLNTERSERITFIKGDSIPDTTRTLPMKIALGVGWRFAPRHVAACDLYFENWSGGNGLLNSAYQLALGYEFRGVDNPFAEYRKRMSYRAGMGYEVLYLRETKEIYGTLGLGLPLGMRGHVLDFSVKYGHRSLDGNTFFAEDYVKLSASVVGVAVWGQPTRKRR